MVKIAGPGNTGSSENVNNNDTNVSGAIIKRQDGNESGSGSVKNQVSKVNLLEKLDDKKLDSDMKVLEGAKLNTGKVKSLISFFEGFNTGLDQTQTVSRPKQNQPEITGTENTAPQPKKISRPKNE